MSENIILRALRESWIEAHENGSVIVMPRLDGLYEEIAALCGWDAPMPQAVEQVQ